MKLFLKILLVIIIIYAAIVTILTFIGNQEIKTLIEEGVLNSDYTQRELAMLCGKLDVEVIFGVVLQVVFGNTNIYWVQIEIYNLTLINLWIYTKFKLRQSLI